MIIIEPSTDEAAVEFIQLPQISEFIIINFDNPVHYTTFDSHDRRVLRTEGAYLLGKANHNRKFHIKLKKPICLIKFKPCSFYIFSNQSATNYLNRIISLNFPLNITDRERITTELNVHLKRYFNKENVLMLKEQNMFDIIAHIEKNFATVTVQKLSNAFHLSETTLFRYFKKYIGVNLTTFIIHTKFKMMLNKMYHKNYNALATIENGFYDQSHFIKQFKKFYHVTPSHFIKEIDLFFQDNDASRALFELCYIKA
jgi:AraC-like DNA-binding protein